MNVKDLIIELLDHDYDAEVEVGIVSETEDDDFGFEIESGGRYLSLVVSLKQKGYVLVDKSDYEDMQKEIERLENQIEELEESK